MWETTSDTETWTRTNLITREDLHTAAGDCEMCVKLKWKTKNRSQEYLRVFSKILYRLPSLPDIWPQCVCVCVQNATSYWDYYTNKRTNRNNRPEQFVLFFPNKSHILDKVNNSKLKFCRNKTKQKNSPHSITSHFVAFWKSQYKHFFQQASNKPTKHWNSFEPWQGTDVSQKTEFIMN